MASALVGTVQFAFGGLSALGLGTLPVKSSMPMSAFILAAGLAGLGVNLLLVGKSGLGKEG
jgi:hypothetical protein